MGALARRPDHPEGVGQLHEVGILQLGPVLPAPGLVEVAGHVAVGAVVEDHRDHVDAVSRGGGELLGVEEEAAVAGDRHHRPVGPRDLGPERDRVGVAEVARVGRREVRTRLVDRPERPRVVADLGHARDQDRVLGCARAERLDDRGVGLHGVLGRRPGPQRLVLRLARGPGRGRGAQALQQGLEGGARVADQAEGVLVVAPDLLLVRVDLHDAGARLEGDLGQAAAHRQHHVRLLHVRPQRGLTPQGGAERERVVVAHRALALRGLGDSGLQVLGHLAERLVRAREVHAAARVDQGPARGEQRLHRAIEVAPRRHLGPHLDGREQLYQSLVLHGLGRHLDLDRARAAAPQLDHRLAHRGWHVGHLEHAPAPLGHRPDALLLVVHLVQEPDVLADAVARDLARDHQHRRRRGVRGAEARHRVQQAGAGHHQRGAERAARARVAVGHEAGGLLVARVDEADARLVPQRGHDPVELDTGQAEDHPHAFLVEGPHQRFAARHRCRRHVSSPPGPAQGASMAPAWASSSMSRSL